MRNMKIFTLALIFNALSGCGSSGEAEATAAAIDLGKACDASVQQCVDQVGQVWVWDEENYDSFAHQEMSEILEGSHNSYLSSFEARVAQISENSDVDYVEIADLWALRYFGIYDSFKPQVKPIIINTYRDYGASTNPERYLENANVAIDAIKSRFTEQYNDFIAPKFAPYQDASEHLASLKIMEQYFSDLDTISIEIAIEIE